MTRFFIVALAFAGVSAPAAFADAQCAPRDKMVRMLDQDFGEILASGGLTTAAKLVEIWASKTTGTWTILVTEAEGRSCVLAAGQDWQDFPESMTSALTDLKG